MMPETENAYLRALFQATKQNDCIDESDLQKIELISKHLLELQEELAKFDNIRCDSGRYFGNL
jgi:hypothetical protein